MTRRFTGLSSRGTFAAKAMALVGMLVIAQGGLLSCPFIPDPMTDPCDDITCDEGSTCVDGTCVVDVVDCDPACADGETCTDGVCVVDTPVDLCEGVVCDDSLFCNGTETCDPDTGDCLAGTAPCDPATSICVELTDTCVGSFTLTPEDDARTGTPGDDAFTATAGSLNPGDIIVGNGGNDTLDATIAASLSDGATIIDFDAVNFTALNASTFDAANSAAIGAFNVDGSGNLTITNLEAGADLGMLNGYDNTLTVTLADATGATDEINLTIDGTGDNASFVYAIGGGGNLETLNVDVAGSTLNQASAANFFADGAGGVVDATVTGSGDLTLGNTTAAALGDLTSLDTTGLGGTLTISAADAGAAQTYDFSAGGLDIAGVDTYVVNDTTPQNHTLTFANADTNVTIDIASLPEGTAAGNATVTQGTGTNDTLSVNLGGDGDGAGNIAAAASETVNINSSGTSGNTIGTVDSSTAAAFVTERVNITGDQNLTTGAVTSEVLDASTFGGDLTTTLGASMQCDGGLGNDDITGSAAADLINGNGGDDTIDGAAGVDIIDGGAGSDTITGGAGDDDITLGAGTDTAVLLSVFAAAPADIDGADEILGGFESGDSIQLDVSNAFADASADLTNNDAATDNKIDIANDGTDTTIRIDLDTDAVDVLAVTIIIRGEVLDDDDFTFDATNELLTRN